MQRSINKEIRHYREDVFMGLNLRQVICSVAAIGLAVVVYFVCKDALGQETASWLCMGAAVPIVAVGFFRFDGLNFERFVCVVFRSRVQCAGWHVWKASNRFCSNKKKRRCK